MGWATITRGGCRLRSVRSVAGSCLGTIAPLAQRKLGIKYETWLK